MLAVVFGMLSCLAFGILFGLAFAGVGGLIFGALSGIACGLLFGLALGVLCPATCDPSRATVGAIVFAVVSSLFSALVFAECQPDPEDAEAEAFWGKSRLDETWLTPEDRPEETNAPMPEIGAEERIA